MKVVIYIGHNVRTRIILLQHN